MDGSWTLDPIHEIADPAHDELPVAPGKVDTWTPERIAELTRLWDEGVTTAEIGRRIGPAG